MTRVRICTSRCRCHSSCRRSRFSALGTHTRGKRSSSSNCSSSAASRRSLFCFRTRLALICAGSPIHKLEAQFRQQPLEPAAMPGRLHPHAHPASVCLQLAIELLGFSLAVTQSPFTAFPGVGIYKRDLLNAGVIVHTYNPHIGSFLPSLGSSTQSLLGRRGADIVLKSDEREHS